MPNYTVSFEIQQRENLAKWCRENREAGADWDRSFTFARIGCFTPIYVNANYSDAKSVVELAKKLITLWSAEDTQLRNKTANELTRLIGEDAFNWLLDSIRWRFKARMKVQREERARAWLQIVNVAEFIHSCDGYDDCYQAFYSVLDDSNSVNDAVFVFGYLMGLEAAQNREKL